MVLDMAMSQFSVGGLATYRSRGERLPVPGGHDVNGQLTDDPAALEESRRLLPIGFWKGSGLSLVLDLAAALLSGGLATFQISPEPERETSLSQIFIAIRLPSDPAASAQLVDGVLEYTLRPAATGERTRYPGERTLQTRERNLAEGIPVDEGVWKSVLTLSG